LVISENCELELAQDAVLSFVPSNKRIIVDEETGNKTTVTIDPPMFKCITLEKESSFVGNHAAIHVPYIFEGTVICTADDGFRYLKDINIIKLVEQNNNNPVHSDLVGFPLSLNKESNGTALLIERSDEENTYGSKELCHLDFSGVNISGAFEYGIKCINTTPEIPGNRNHNTHIKAVVDGCRTGVFMCNYSDARVSAIITPRFSYDSVTAEEIYRFAEHGILLENCTNIDLRNSRIEYIDLGSIEPDPSAEFQHMVLINNCPGLMINSSLCSGMDSTNVRDYIHTNTLGNFDNMTVLGEPNADYFNYERDSVMGIIFPNFRVGTSDMLVPDSDRTASGFIPCENNSVIKLKGISFDFNVTEDELKTYRIRLYDNNKEYTKGTNGIYFMNNKHFDFNYDANVNTTEITIRVPGTKYMRFCCNSTGISYDSSIEINEKNFRCKDGYIKDRTYIKSHYIKELGKDLQQLSNRITALEKT